MTFRLMCWYALLAQRTTTAESKRMVPSTVDRQLTLLVGTVLLERIRRSNTASIMANITTTPWSATSFPAGPRTALWAIVPVEAADGVVEVAAHLGITVADTAAGTGTDAAGDAAVAEDTHLHMLPTSHTLPPITTL